MCIRDRCNLCVLCVSVVDEFRVKLHHRDTEDTEVAQRNPRRTFCAKPWHIIDLSAVSELLLSPTIEPLPSCRSADQYHAETSVQVSPESGPPCFAGVILCTLVAVT